MRNLVAEVEKFTGHAASDFIKELAEKEAELLAEALDTLEKRRRENVASNLRHILNQQRQEG